MTVFMVEVRRCLARRLVWVLLAIALVGIVVTGVIVLANKPGPFDQPFYLTDLWPVGGDPPAVAAASVFLVIGGLLGGASMVGADWRSGTMVTLLTWEPRRERLAVAKLAAAGALAWLFAMALMVLLVLAIVPGVSSTSGADGEWLRVLAGGIFRTGAMTAMATVIGASIAMIGRNTAAAFGVAFAYLMVGENIVRAWKPWLRSWLLGENGTIFLLGRGFDDVIAAGRGFGAAALTLMAYTLGLAAAAVASFRLRDIAG